MCRPSAFKARKAESLPGPGPLTLTSRFFNPNSLAALPAFSAATCAANGVLFLDPLKPEPPAVAQDKVFPVWAKDKEVVAIIGQHTFLK